MRINNCVKACFQVLFLTALVARPLSLTDGAGAINDRSGDVTTTTGTTTTITTIGGSHKGESDSAEYNLRGNSLGVSSSFMSMVKNAALELSSFEERKKRKLNGSNEPWPIFARERDRRRRMTSEEFPGKEEMQKELSVEVSYEEIYDTLIFLFAAVVMGQASEFVGMPSLVGEIVTGFLLGPPLANYVPFPEAMVLIGEIGLIMLLLEAGVEIDVAQLKVTGTRSLAIAVTGSTLPLLTGLGLGLAAGLSTKAAIAAGACFSPTSLGVASNALTTGKVMNTPVGQLIIAAAVFDDVIGLIILSCLQVLVREDAKVYQYFVPLVSSFGYLIVLGLSAITWLPKFIESRILIRFREDDRSLVAFCMMFALLLGYLPLLYYSKSSYLTGAFLTGLSFSQIPTLHSTFVHQTKQLMGWLLRIFFAATIGFQVPIKNFGDPWVIGWGFAFYVAVLAKLPLGFFAPHFKQQVPSDYPFNPHTRDVVITGLAMTCRGEMSFIIASFALGNGLFDPDIYSALVFTVLISCIANPFMLLSSIKYYNKKAARFLSEVHALSPEMINAGKVPLYVVVQVRTDLRWGLSEILIRAAGECGLMIIDHRQWHPRGLNSTIATEMYAEDSVVKIDLVHKQLSLEESSDGDERNRAVGSERDDSNAVLIRARCEEIKSVFSLAIASPTAKIEVLEWVPKVAVAYDEMSDDNRQAALFNLAEEELTDHEVIEANLDLAPRLKRSILRSASYTLGTSMFQEGTGSGAASSGVQAERKHDDNHTSDNSVQRMEDRATTTDAAAAFNSLLRRRVRAKQVSSPNLSTSMDLWNKDAEGQLAFKKSAIVVPHVQYDLSGHSYGQGRRTKMKSDLNAIMEDMPSIEERLGGFVRQELDDDGAHLHARKKE